PRQDAHCRSWKALPRRVFLVRRGLGPPCSRQEPSHDRLVGVSAAANLVLLNRLLSECGRLLPTLSLVARKRHPFTDDGSPRGMLGPHGQTPSRSFLHRS